MTKLSVQKVSVTVALFCVLEATSAYGQVTSDNSVNSRVSVQGNIFRIEEGTTKGSNLFHSFQSFSVSTGRTAHFDHAANIQNIFSRVTGTSTSNIDGIVKANSTANLFLLNPNGIIFGRNARLDIGGSFLGTTANSIKFADGTQFSAIAPKSSPLLTVSAPVGLQLDNNSGDIRVAGRGHQLSISFFSPISREDSPQGLQVLPGKNLALIGSDVSLAGGELIAPGGHIELGSVKQGNVSLNTVTPQWSFGYQSHSKFGRIELSNRTLLDTSGPGSASIGIYGRQVLIKENSVVVMQNQGRLPDRSLNIKATNLIDVSNADIPGVIPTGLYSESVNFGSSAQISLFAPDIVIRDGSILDSRTFSSVKGGNISIKAPNSFKILGASTLNPGRVAQINSLTFSPGKAGDVDIITQKLAINEGGRLSSLTFGKGVGGNIEVQAELVEVFGFDQESLQGSTIQAGTFGPGDAGSLAINASRVRLGNGGSFSSTTLGSGNGGDLTINSHEFIEVSGIGPEAVLPSIITAEANKVDPQIQQIFRLPPLPSGNAGNVTIKTPLLRVVDGGRISVLNAGTGDAGELKISANTIILKNKSSLTAVTATGKGGNIKTFSSLFFLDNATISASAQGNGTGGNIDVKAILFVGFGENIISADAINNQGGNIRIDTVGLFLSEKTKITATSGAGAQKNGTVTQNTQRTGAEEATTPAPVTTPTPKVSSVCNPSGKVSEFVVLGSGGLQEDIQSERSKDLEWEMGSSNLITAHSNTESPKALLVEAKGWQRLDDHRIRLTANAQDSSNKVAAHPTPCNQSS